MNCKLIKHESRDSYSPKRCRFVSSLDFDRKTAGRMNSIGNNQSPIVFSDLLTRGNNSRVRYQNGPLQETTDSSIDAIVVSVQALSNNFPKSGEDRFALQARNLRCLYPDGKISFRLNSTSLRNALLVMKPDDQLIYDQLESLVSYGFVARTENKYQFIITRDGFHANPTSTKCYSNTAFIALAFKDNDALINTIRGAIRSCGYIPVDMAHHQHNNYIMDEILKQIEDCKFLVCDLTIPNQGAYFEMGYALGLKKAVILTCSKKTFTDDNLMPHFDLRQFNTTTWTNLEDLTSQLMRRITDTIGSNQLEEGAL